MKNLKYIFLLFSILIIGSLFGQDAPIGWASYNGGTTGGEGGESVIVENRSEFITAVNSIEPKIIYIKDTLELVLYERIDVRSNKTILGLTENAMIRYGGLSLRGNNIIVRNLVIGDSYDGDWEGKTNSTDGITVFGENVWIDHIWFKAAADGLLDVTSSTSSVGDFVTISYCRFSDHNKVSLIGSSVDNIRDRDHLKVTYHHCWFDGTLDKGVHQRMPRARFGDVHVFNTYFEEVVGYCVGARIESDIVIENTYFRNSVNPHNIDDIGMGIEDPDIVSIGNEYELCSGTTTTNGDAFVPSDFYAYTPDEVESVPQIVMNNAGPYNPISNIAPIAVNDSFDLSNTTGLFILDPLVNDIDPDSEVLKVAQVINEPNGIGFVKENKIYFAPQSNGIGIDTVIYSVVDLDGGVDTGYVFLFLDGISSTGEVDIQIKDILLYPNPVRQKLNIQFPELNDETIEYAISSASGIFVQNGYVKNNQTEIDVERLVSGLYYISFTIGNQLFSKRFYIQND